MNRRRWLADVLLQGAGILTLVIGLGALGALIGDVLIDGAGRLSWQFLTSIPSRRASAAGILPAFVGSLYVIGLTILMAVPAGPRRRSSRSRPAGATPS